MPEPIRIAFTPAPLARLEQAGLVPGAGNVAVWLTERAETLAALLAPVEGVDVAVVLRRGADLESVMAVPAAERTTEQRRDRDLLLISQAVAAPVLARALVQARARFAEVEKERVDLINGADLAADRANRHRQERDAARAEVARLKRALVEPTEETGDPDSEQGEGVVS